MLILPPRTSWLYRSTVSLSATRRYLITLLFIAACIALWFHYIYEPLNKRIASVKQEQRKLSQETSSEDLTEKINALRKQLAQPSSTAADNDQLNTILGYVDHAGMILEHCSVQDKAFHVQALGTYNQFLVFFDQLASSAQTLLPRDVRITRGVDNLFSLSLVIESH